MPWNVLKGSGAEDIYTNIDQSLNYFYFINDMHLEELDGLGLYKGSLQYVSPYREWLTRFVRHWGAFLSTPQSWNEEYYRLIYKDEKFGLKNGQYEPPENWRSFNDFFSRRLSSPEMRPVASPEDERVVVSPADSKVQGAWRIDKDSHILDDNGFRIKSGRFGSVDELLGRDSRYVGCFSGGVLTHTFLDVHDYHRYHFPVSGVVREVRIMPGDTASGGEMRWDSAAKRYVLDSRVPGWQMIETRGCVVVETEKFGEVAVLPVGMSQISSINFECDVKEGKHVCKGDILGYFLFGGSDIIMLFSRKADFKLSVKAGGDGEGYPHILTGEEFGRVFGA